MHKELELALAAGVMAYPWSTRKEAFAFAANPPNIRRVTVGAFSAHKLGASPPTLSNRVSIRAAAIL
ncbi:hypothetical protein AURDEDRAFT_177653 [Auricularia subglabra TFB-10046 SS5]|uniref:Uncharacterized protein n=1 Tax=Auricularia subglabra (strain TFB-10046 / SS5) TaxID=717982 RepID=J0WLR4_AURST|nr:hypothetical protein AURDEDRAFT_177653 [Auricularia subglabra TFB-10046 SS5]